MQNPQVWSDKNKVSKIGAEIKEIKEKLDNLNRWTTFVEDAQAALELADNDILAEALDNLKKQKKNLINLK